MYKAAIIGVSGYGEVHYTDLKNEVENGEAEIVAATVINQEEEKEKCDWLRSQGAVLFTDYRDMLDQFRGKIDLCCIPTGIAFHAEMSIAAMRAGANVFVEKPVAATIQEVREIQQVEQETGKFVAVGYQYIYQPDIHAVKQLLLDGVLGKLKTLKCHAVSGRNSAYYSRNNWAGRLRSGEAWILDCPYNNAQAHYLNLLCFFAGKEFRKAAEIETVEAELYRANGIESNDTACIRIKTPDDVRICFYATHACSQNRGQFIVITGEKGSIVFDKEKSEMDVCLNDGSGFTVTRTPVADLSAHMFNALRRRLAGEDVFICDLELAASQTLCCNGAYESSQIHAIPDTCKLEVNELDGSEHVEINSIEDIIEQAFEEDKLFSELDIPWAKPGLPVQMSGYRQFSGGRCVLQ